MAFARIVTHYFHHHAWPAAELHLVATGHAGGEEMTARTPGGDQPVRAAGLLVARQS
jgi:hypothetical protein